MASVNKNIKVENGGKQKESKFIIITGPNGTGKSIFLRQYYHSVRDLNLSAEKTFYMSSQDTFDKNNYPLTNSEGSGILYNYKPSDEYVKEIIKVAKDEVSHKTNKSSPFMGIADLAKNHIVKNYKSEDLLNKEDEVVKNIKSVMFDSVNASKVDPKAYLRQMFCAYLKRFQDCISLIKDGKNFTKLFCFYIKHLQTQNNLIENDFLKQCQSNEDFFIEVLIKYAFHKCRVRKFADDLNAMLKKIGYKYKFTVEPEKNIHNPSLNLLLSDQNDRTTNFLDVELSSGESWILGVLMWQYNSTDSTYRTPIKVKEIILDEPDRHLDPKLCKQFLNIVTKVFIPNGIQVVMTTHRVDTVALAQNDCIYKLPKDYEYNTIYKSGEDQLNSLQKSCKAEAIFRMSSNLREIINYHHKVYTEALDDAYFYENVYSFLRAYCSEVRQNARANVVEKDNRFYWDIKGKKVRILSERCQLSFYPVSTTGNDQGGCEEVKKAVRRGQNFHGAIKGLFDELALLKPYGILDNDYDKKHNFSSKGKIDIKDYIVTLERHSFENFLYDPFILVSIASYMSSDISKFSKCYQVLKNALDKKPVELGEVQYATNQCFYHLIKNNDKVDKALIKEKIHKKIKKSIKFESELESAKDYASSKLDQIFDFDIEKDLDKLITEICNRDAFSKDANVKEPDALYDIIKPQQIINRRIVEHFKIDSLNKLGTQKIAVIIDKKESIEVEYPNLFLRWRGHELNCPVKSGKKTLLNNLQKMSTNLLEEIHLFIPMDLANIFFELSSKVREHVREKIKPDDKK